MSIDDTEIQTVSDRVLDKFLKELANESDMEETSHRLREAIFGKNPINEKAIREALFGESEA